MHTTPSEIFPAIDLVWKSGNCVYVVQLHVSNHDDVVEAEGLCRGARWFQQFAEIYLIYLSPEDAVMTLVRGLIQGDHHVRQLRSDPDHSGASRAISKESIECLQELQWPEGCSLNAGA